MSNSLSAAGDAERGPRRPPGGAEQRLYSRPVPRTAGGVAQRQDPLPGVDDC